MGKLKGVLELFFDKLYSFKLQFSSIFTSLIVTKYCNLKGISIGERAKFYGFAFFYKRAHSEINIGSNCTFRSNTTSNLVGINRQCMISTLTNSAKIEIGNNCGFSGTVISSFNLIKFGDNVRCGANTLITDSDWHSNDSRSGPSNPIYIENNVWLGEGVKVLKGVTIGENSVIGAGSVVSKTIPSNVIAAGNPCRIIRDIIPKIV